MEKQKTTLQHLLRLPQVTINMPQHLKLQKEKEKDPIVKKVKKVAARSSFDLKLARKRGLAQCHQLHRRLLKSTTIQNLGL